MIINFGSWRCWHFLVLASLSTLITITACSPEVAQVSLPPSDKIRIGVIAPLTGAIPEVGESTRLAAQLATEEINQQGGITLEGQQKTVEILIEDSQVNPEVAQQVAQSLINQAGVIALVGPQASDTAIPVADVAERSQVVMVTPWSTATETTQDKSYVFRVGFIDAVQGEVLARFARQELQAQRVGIVYNLASEYNRGLAWRFRDVFQAAGGQEVATEAYGENTTDYKPQLASVLAIDPDILFLPNYVDEVPAQIQQAEELQLPGLTLMGGDTWSQLDFSLYPGLEGAYFSTLYAADAPQAANQEFVQRYRAAYDREPDDVAALTYDAFQLIFAAIAQQGTADRESVRLGLEQLKDFAGVTGTFDYRNGHDPDKSVFIVQVKAGKPVLQQEVNLETPLTQSQ